MGEHRDWVLAQVASGGDVTLQGLAGGLVERGLKVDYRTMWNFMRREGKSFKKIMATSRPDPTLPASANGGAGAAWALADPDLPRRFAGRDKGVLSPQGVAFVVGNAQAL